MTEGILLKGIGGFYDVLCADGTTSVCKACGRFRNEHITPTVGDRVQFTSQKEGYPLITEILPRKNRLVRPPVANIDLLVIVVSATVPEPDWLLVDKLIVQAMLLSVTPLIVMNKTDEAGEATTAAFLRDYAAFSPLLVSAANGMGMDALRARLSKMVSCFAGQSAVGKSSLLNNLIPELTLETGGLTRKTARGRHTTRRAELWPYQGGAVLDTPGFSLYEPDCIEQDALNSCYPEFPGAEPCYYPSCAHISEPNCGVKKLLDEGKIPLARYERYCEIAKEIQLRRKHRFD